MISEQQVGIAARLYQCRRTLLALQGPAKFKAKVEEYRPIIQAAMAKHQCNEIQAGMELAKVLNAKGYEGMPILIVMAVVVEMVEPTPGL